MLQKFFSCPKQRYLCSDFLKFRTAAILVLLMVGHQNT